MYEAAPETALNDKPGPGGGTAEESEEGEASEEGASAESADSSEGTEEPKDA